MSQTYTVEVSKGGFYDQQNVLFMFLLGEGIDSFLKWCIAHAADQLLLFYKVHSNIVDSQCCRLVC